MTIFIFYNFIMALTVSPSCTLSVFRAGLASGRLDWAAFSDWRPNRAFQAFGSCSAAHHYFFACQIDDFLVGH